MNKIISWSIALFLAVYCCSSFVYLVDQRRFALVYGLGKIKRMVSEEGIKFKLPFPLERIVFIDKRIQTIDNAEADRYITKEKKNLLVNLFIKWRVFDPSKFQISFQGDTSFAEDRLRQIIRSALNEEITKHTLTQVVSDKREDVTRSVRGKVESDVRAVGIEIIDVRLKRVDLLSEISSSVYARMISERSRVASRVRSEGMRRAEAIRAEADRRKEVMLANAYRESEILKGEGDSMAAAVYSQAFARDSDFYSFYRSMQAYRSIFHRKGDNLIFADSSDHFFRYLKDTLQKSSK